MIFVQVIITCHHHHHPPPPPPHIYIYISIHIHMICNPYFIPKVVCHVSLGLFDPYGMQPPGHRGQRKEGGLRLRSMADMATDIWWRSLQVAIKFGFIDGKSPKVNPGYPHVVVPCSTPNFFMDGVCRCILPSSHLTWKKEANSAGPPRGYDLRGQCGSEAGLGRDAQSSPWLFYSGFNGIYSGFNEILMGNHGKFMGYTLW